MRRYFYRIVTGQSRGPSDLALKAILSFLSLFYLMAIKLRLGLYSLGIFKSRRLRAPVISIGNITWGGTGKTPLVEAICLYFKSQAKRTALLMRGYGADEDRVLAEGMPGVSVLVGKDRVKNAGLAEEKGPFDIFVLDDGFQHHRIRRDIDIVAINATDPFGSGLLIPAGILREPVSHLSRADIVVITRSDLVPRKELSRIREDILKANPDAAIFESAHQPISLYTRQKRELGLEYIKGRITCVLSALGDNRSFAETLKNLGAEIRAQYLYMDHHRYAKGEIDKIIRECKGRHIDTVVTTQKDWVKLRGLLTDDLGGIEFLVLNIKLKINDEEKFLGRLSSLPSG